MTEDSQIRPGGAIHHRRSGTPHAGVSFVVLNWRNEQRTRECVASIAAQTSKAVREVIVVDNESSAASRAVLETTGVALVTHSRNLGFAGGMNSGAAVASGDFIALINNDAKLSPDWTTRALDAMKDPQIGVVGGRDHESTLPVVSPTGFPVLTSLDVPRMEVPAVDGAHLLVRRTAWAEIGGFDEDFFAYYDELDLCARFLARGWRVVYDPDLRVAHTRGASSDRVRWRRLFWARRNRTIWLAKHFPASEWRGAVVSAALEYLAEAAGKPKRPGGLSDRLARRYAGLASFGWVVTHGRWLAAKRRTAVLAGLHSELYRAQVTSAYEELRQLHPTDPLFWG